MSLQVGLGWDMLHRMIIHCCGASPTFWQSRAQEQLARQAVLRLLLEHGILAEEEQRCAALSPLGMGIYSISLQWEYIKNRWKPRHGIKQAH